MAHEKRIIVNFECDEVRVALLETNTLCEFYIEREEEKRFVGNIYKGKVSSVVPGIQSAFVDIGLQKNGFLYVSDVIDPSLQNKIFDDNNMDIQALKASYKSNIPIEKMLSAGDEVIVQVEKDPIGTKGVRLTSFISLPGRFTVLMPQTSNRSISRRISDYEECQRLRSIMDDMRCLKNYGCIMRTASEKRSKKEIASDFRYLTKTWNAILRLDKKKESPHMLHEESTLILRIVRDYFENVEEFVIDDKVQYQKLRNFLNSYMPEVRKKVVRYRNPENIFEFYGVESQIKKIYARNVYLPCGGYLVFDETEALVAIDINSGRNVGKGDFEKTIFKTNMAAALEIPRQLRLRDIGGLVVIDFIDMKSRKNQQEIWSTLLKEVRKEKNRINVSPISKMGLVQMTRQRNGSGVHSLLHEPCYFCDGRGYVKTLVSSCLDVIRNINRVFLRTSESHLIIALNSLVADFLLSKYRENIFMIERTFKKRIDIRKEVLYKREEFCFFSGTTKKEIELWS